MKVRLAGSAILLALLWAISIPAEPIVRLCPFHWLTGLPCPLCGLTRGLFALAKGHWSEAIHFNALSPVGFAMVFSAPWKSCWQKPLWTLGLASFAIYGVYRVFAAA
jgi:Protein of unknown function (DUF2752)